MKVGLALGSGGARGLAHIALFEKLNSIGITPYSIAGSSAGAVIGGLYCLYGLDGLMDRMLEVVRLNKEIVAKTDELMGKKRNLKNEVVEMSKIVMAHSLLTGNVIYDSLKYLFGSKRFSDCKIDFAAVTFDIEHEKAIVIDEGFLVDAIVSSSSVPGTFPPVRLGGMRLVDGGTTRVIPVKETRERGVDFVIASDVSPFVPDLSNMLSIQYTVDDVKGRILADMDLSEADLAIKFNIPKIQWYDFSKSKQIYQIAKKELENVDFRSVLKEHDPETSS